MKTSILIAALALSGAAAAQTISGGPVTGPVFDTVTHSVRPVIGVPGAAYLGGAAASTWDLAAPSPDGTKAAALRGSNLYFLADLDNPDAAVRAGSVIDAIDRMVWSADASTLAVYSSRSGQLQRVTALDGAPVIEAPVDLSTLGSIAGWSLSPDGKSIAASAGSGETRSVYLICGGSAPLKLGGIQNPGALVFSPDGASLFVYDRGAQQIVKLQVSSGAVSDSFAAPSAATVRRSLTRVASGRGANPDIAALAIAGTNLLAARGRSVCLYDLNHHNADTCQALDISPSSFAAVSPGIFQLNYPRASASPVWLWDAQTAHAYFVPASQPSDARSGN